MYVYEISLQKHKDSTVPMHGICMNSNNKSIEKMAIEAKMMEYQCTICSVQFATEVEIKLHLKTVMTHYMFINPFLSFIEIGNPTSCSLSRYWQFKSLKLQKKLGF